MQDAMPLWLSRILSAGGIFKSSFSKYGEAYRRELAYQKEKTIERGGLILPDAA